MMINILSTAHLLFILIYREHIILKAVLFVWPCIVHLLQNFLESEGLDVNPGEDMPSDPYIERRKEKAALRTYTTASAFDKQKQFLELDRKVLRFYVVWDDTTQMFGEKRPFVIHVSIWILNTCSRKFHNINMYVCNI